MKLKLNVIALLFVLLLSACGTGNDETSGTKEEKDEPVEESLDETKETIDVEALRQLSDEKSEDYPTVELVTSMGSITIELYPDVAPKAVENFITHGKEGYYEGVTFHRILKDFMIQGGDPDGTGMGGESIYGSDFEDEFSPKVMHFRGALAMANSGANTNGSQFFIVQNPTIDENLQAQMKEAQFPEELIKAYAEQGGTPWLDFKHTVFGQVIEGMNVVDQIAAVEVDAQGKPKQPVTIEKVNVKE
ncbi:peptidylprolyl isomerase [Bacillus suaedaesalsae]|uniref:Peptidyl-prolyl cis-trans isomerase n=1 Tax=Bacillus suaedaesalsae TaxID=2810349 RepID=A0ABS2DJR0_9BACI|nr:peptidylprolyl isomerase [Bacillus suaedaesalsae]MBM6618724.1 peptidylprolyl isomerase [Bacillus suaedaesalsae]